MSHFFLWHNFLNLQSDATHPILLSVFPSLPSTALIRDCNNNDHLRFKDTCYLCSIPPKYWASSPSLTYCLQGLAFNSKLSYLMKKAKIKNGGLNFKDRRLGVDRTGKLVWDVTAVTTCPTRKLLGITVLSMQESNEQIASKYSGFVFFFLLILWAGSKSVSLVEKSELDVSSLKICLKICFFCIKMGEVWGLANFVENVNVLIFFLVCF